MSNVYQHTGPRVQNHHIQKSCPSRTLDLHHANYEWTIGGGSKGTQQDHIALKVLYMYPHTGRSYTVVPFFACRVWRLRVAVHYVDTVKLAYIGLEANATITGFVIWPWLQRLDSDHFCRNVRPSGTIT